ncbi:MAG: hypothetical protein ACYDHP_03230 [Ferrimicrobium sp.]
MLVGFLVHLKSSRTARSYMESMGEGFLTIVRESERLSGRRPDLIVQGGSVKLVIYAGNRG